MEENPTTQSPVAFSREGLFVQGRPVILLTSSLFYFRIPRGLWADRLQKVKAAGYNAIDVYLPWNHHELAEGQWDFQGERDVAAFLRLAAEAGLWVVARPGPYICSEWDGGGLPAYLFTDGQMRLRDNDPRFLQHVARWYDRILPVLRAFELGRGGSVVAVQLENELDFYDCADRPGYMQALRDMARLHGIGVPLIACVGQGDITGASGDVEDVVPTLNLYHDERDPGVEARAAHYQAELACRGLPLCVTETKRSHAFLRRLLACGAKWLGPYNQTGGTNFGFSNAVNNWGSPLSLVTSDYDFGGMISSAGALRPEFAEARVLARLVAALGPALALAVPARKHGIMFQTGLQPVDCGPFALALHGGGLLVALPNIGDEERTVTLRDGRGEFPRHTRLAVAPGSCPLVLRDVPLAIWGLEGALVYATGELAAAEAVDGGTLLAFHTDRVAELAFAFPAGATVHAGEGMSVSTEGGEHAFSFAAGHPVAATVRFPGGRRLEIVGLDRRDAPWVEGRSSGGVPVLGKWRPGASATHSRDGSLELALRWAAAPAQAPIGPVRTCGDRPPRLEEVGVLRGVGWYGARVRTASRTPVAGFLLQDGADILSLYVDGAHLGTVVPGGGSAYLPATDPTRDQADLLVRVEIWGHSNFDDARLPALRLNSLRGLANIVAVTRHQDISHNWHYQHLDTGQPAQPSGECSGLPLVGWGGWLSTRRPNAGCYHKRILAARDADRWVLYFQGLEAQAEASANGGPSLPINPLNPYADISPWVQAGQPINLMLYLEQSHGRSAGRVFLLEGRAATDWWVAGAGEAELWAAAVEAQSQATCAGLPYRLPPGDVTWLLAELDEVEGRPGGWAVSCQGRNAKVSAFLNGRLVGRLWLPSATRPRLVGGVDDRLFLPGPWWRQAANRLALLVEAIAANEPAEITQVTFRPLDGAW